MGNLFGRELLLCSFFLYYYLLEKIRERDKERSPRTSLRMEHQNRENLLSPSLGNKNSKAVKNANAIDLTLSAVSLTEAAGCGNMAYGTTQNRKNWFFLNQSLDDEAALWSMGHSEGKQKSIGLMFGNSWLKSCCLVKTSSKTKRKCIFLQQWNQRMIKSVTVIGLNMVRNSNV